MGVPKRGFSDAEFAQRTESAQRLMKQYNIDLLWFSTEPEMRYFSGFQSQFWQSPTRPWFLLIPANGKPVAVIPAIGQSAFARTWLDDIRCWPSPQPTDEGLSLLLQSMKELCPAAGRIGTLMGRETHVRMPLADLDQLRSALGSRGLVDASDIVRTLRSIKSAAEIEKIRYCCDVASGVFEELPNWVSCGDSEQAIFRRFKVAMLQAGVDDVSYLVGGAASGGYDDIISPARELATKTGDVLILDTGSVFDGYFCDFDRNYAFGHVSSDVASTHELLWQATEAGFAAARPGVSAGHVYQAMHKVLQAGGGDVGNVGRMGHGLGIQLTESPSIAAFDDTPLKAGMVLTLEPGLAYAPHKMLVHEENILLHSDGAEYLSRRAPQAMPII